MVGSSVGTFKLNSSLALNCSNASITVIYFNFVIICTFTLLFIIVYVYCHRLLLFHIRFVTENTLFISTFFFILFMYNI